MRLRLLFLVLAISAVTAACGGGYTRPVVIGSTAREGESYGGVIVGPKARDGEPYGGDAVWVKCTIRNHGASGEVRVMAELQKVGVKQEKRVIFWIDADQEVVFSFGFREGFPDTGPTGYQYACKAYRYLDLSTDLPARRTPHWSDFFRDG